MFNVYDRQTRFLFFLSFSFSREYYFIFHSVMHAGAFTLVRSCYFPAKVLTFYLRSFTRPFIFIHDSKLLTGPNFQFHSPVRVTQCVFPLVDRRIAAQLCQWRVLDSPASISSSDGQTSQCLSSLLAAERSRDREGPAYRKLLHGNPINGHASFPFIGIQSYRDETVLPAIGTSSVLTARIIEAIRGNHFELAPFSFTRCHRFETIRLFYVPLSSGVCVCKRCKRFSETGPANFHEVRRSVLFAIK